MSENWSDLAAPAAPAASDWSDLKASPTENWSDLKAAPEVPSLTGMVQRIGASFPKGNPNSPLSQAIEAHSRSAGQQFGEGLQQMFGQGDWARGGPNDSDPLTNLGNLPMGAFKAMSGMFSGATALPQAITDVSVGNALAKATENAPHGDWYDLRMPGTFVGDLGANTLGWLAGGPHITPEIAARSDARIWAQHSTEAEAARAAYTPPTPPAPKTPTAVLTPDDLWARQQHQESGGNQSAVSAKGARGVSQLMPNTAAQVAAQVGRPELADVAMQDTPEGKAANDYLGRVYMGQQLDTFHDPAVALAAYNAGPTRASEWISRFGSPDVIGRGKWIDMIPFKETRDYVRRILGDAAPAETDLTPQETDVSNQALHSHLSDGGYLPTQRDLIQQASDEAAAAHNISPENPEIPPEKNASPPQNENWADLQSEAMPWDNEEPGAQPEAAPLDLTDQALDHMRAGTKPKLNEGPSLLQSLAEAGGVRDEGGELSGLDMGKGDRLAKMAFRKTGGMSLADAVEWAQNEGYLPKDAYDEHAPTESTGADALVEAIRRELSGERVYPQERINHEGRLVQEHMGDLDEFMHQLGVDPATHTNAQIKAAMDDYFKGASQPAESILGVRASPADAAIRNAQAERASRIQARDAVYASTHGNLRWERQADAVAAGEAPPIDLAGTRASIWRGLAQALDVPVRQGRISLRKALGTYDRKSGVVRVKSAHDVGVESHELAHAMEFTKKYPSLLAEMVKFEKGLKANDYDPLAQRRHEGFAEWMRTYVTNPEIARQQVPGFYDAFEKAMQADDPKVLQALKSAQKQYGDLMAAPSLQSFAHEIVRRGRPGLMQSFMNIATSHGLQNASVGDAVNMLWKQAANETYRGLVDKLNPWRQAVEDLQAIAARNGVHVKLLAANDPYKLLRQVPAVYAAGHMDLIHGPTAYHGLEPAAPSLAHALELALGSKYDVAKGGTADEFDAYLAARRLRNDYGLNSVTGAEPSHDFTKGYFDQIVSDAEAKHPTWEQAAHMIYEYNAAMWEKRHAAGFLTDKDFEDALSHNPDYVPLYRDVSDRGAVPGETGKSTKSAGGSRRRMNLGSEAYMSPTESMMQNAYELSALIAHNDALKALDGLAKIAGPDAGRIVERIPASVMSATKVGVDEILDSAGREIGVSRADRVLAKQTIATLFGEDAAGTVYRAKDAAEKGEPIVYMWDKGERIPLRLPDGAWGHNMIQAFAGMTPAMHGWAFELLALPARIQRLAIVTHPSFLLTNTFKDQIDATLRTDLGYRPYVDQYLGVKHELKGDRVAQDYNRVGGAIGGMQSAEERTARLKADIRVLHSKGIAIRHFVSFKALAHATELSETGTRMGLYERGAQKFAGEGLSSYEAAKESAFEARDYMDFDRRGAWPFVQVLARLVPFMNASIQALDKTGRVTGGLMEPNEVVERYFGGPPATREEQAKFDTAVKLWTGAVLLAAGSMAWRAANKNNPEYEEILQYMRDTAWVIPIGDTHYIAIPKPYEIGSLSNAAERWYEAAAEHDPTAWGKLAKGIATNLMPPIDPAIAQLVWGLGTNKNSLGAPIVPEDMKNVRPEFQYSDRTSEFGKAVGHATRNLPGNLPQSPADVDFMVQTLGATFGREALNLTNQARAPIGLDFADLPVFDRGVKEWTRGAESTKQFYTLMSGNSGDWVGATASVQKLVRDGETDKAAQFISGLDPEQRAYVVLNLVGDGAMKDFHPMVRAQATSSAMQGLAFNLQQGNVKALEPGGAQVVDLTPAQRRDAVDALHKMAVSEQRNALIVSDIPGYTEAKPLPYDKFMSELRAASPELPIVLSERLALGDPKLPSAADSYTVWKQLGPKLAAASPETIKAILDDKSIQGTAGLLRALEKPVPVK